jgi:hypothetical protein
VKKLKCLDQGLKSAANLLQIYYRELEIKVLVKKRPVQWRIEICCKSDTGLKKFFFFPEAEISLRWRIEICCKSTYHRELMKVLVKKKPLQWRIETLWVSLLQNPFCSLEITCIDAAAAFSS